MSPKRTIFPNNNLLSFARFPGFFDTRKQTNSTFFQITVLRWWPIWMSQKGRKAAWKVICWKNWLQSPSSRYPVLDKVSVCRCHALQGSFFVWAGWLYFCDAHALIGSGRWRFIRIPEPKNVMILVVTGMASQVIYIQQGHTSRLFYELWFWEVAWCTSPHKKVIQPSLVATAKKELSKLSWHTAYLTERLGGKNYKKIDVGRTLTDFEGGDQCGLVVLVTPGWRRDHKTPCV